MVQQPPIPIKDSLLTLLDEYQQLTSQLFKTVANLSSTSTDTTSHEPNTSSDSIKDILHQLHSLDGKFASQIQLARKHSFNQDRILELVKNIKHRDKQNVDNIRALNSLNKDVKLLLDSSEKELRNIDHAQQFPLDYNTLLAYSYSLSGVTSSRSKLNKRKSQLENGPNQNEGGEFETENQNQPDENDLEMEGPPSFPFPDEAMMRRGTLNQRGGNGIYSWKDYLRDTSRENQNGNGNGDENQVHQQQQQQHHGHHGHYQEGRMEEDEDAFDLDL